MLKKCPLGDRRDPILDSINEGVFTVNLNWQITSFNRAAEKITGIPREQALGRPCRHVLRANICRKSCALKATLSSGRPTVNASVFIESPNGQRIPIKVSTAVLHDENGQVMGGVETFQDLRQVEALRKQLQKKYTFSDIVGKSAAISKIFDLLPQVAASPSTVLLEGASGTGKELFARAIHQLSPRRHRRFVAVNCAALPDTLLESELFGYKAGAFTDAKRHKPGRFAMAHGGTLFLDEIGEITPAMQVKLLRVLQEKTYEPLGAVAPEPADVRVVAATNQNLHQRVAQGTFREDLFYRIHVIHLAIPPLAQRREDIPLLVDHFVSTNNQLQGKEIRGLSAEAFGLLMGHGFPGNVRELQNILEHAFVLCREGMIEVDHLPEYLRQGQPAAFSWCAPGRLHLKAVEQAVIQEALRKHQGNRGLAAQELGINPSTLYRKLKQLGLQGPSRDGRSQRKRGGQAGDYSKTRAPGRGSG